MLDIKVGKDKELILEGRFDSTQVEKARSVFLSLADDATVDFAHLDYISSAGLGVLLAAQKNLADRGKGLRLINVNSHIRDVFHFSGFDQIFIIE